MKWKRSLSIGWELSKFMHEQYMGEHNVRQCASRLVLLGMGLFAGYQNKAHTLDDVWVLWQVNVRKSFWFRKLYRDACGEFATRALCEGLVAARTIWQLDLKKKLQHREPKSERQLLTYIWLAELMQGLKCRPEGDTGDLALKWYGYAVSMRWSDL